MKKLSLPYLNTLRLILGAFLTGLAVIISGFVKLPMLKEYFPFVGTILILIATWIMYYTENKNLGALGVDLKRRNLLYLPVGLILGIVAFLMGFYLRTFVTGEEFSLNHNIIIANVFKQLYWILPTAAVQQFIIRGYCFKKIVEMSNESIAIIICGLVFIAMHDVWNGNIVGIIGYVSTLFIGHLMFCEALLKSGTIYFAISLHWGNNFANSTLLTEGRKDTSLIYTINPHPPNMGWMEFILMLLLANMGFIILTIVIWKWQPKKMAAITP